MRRQTLLLLDSVNSYLGAWVTAGVALGGVIFSAIQSITNAVSKYFVIKNKSDNALKIEKQKTKQKELAIKQEQKKTIQEAFKNYYVQTALSIYKKEKTEAQIIAFGQLVPYASDVGFNSNLYDIQDKIASEDFVSANKKFHTYLSNLKTEEKRLLSRLELQQPMGHTDGSLEQPIGQDMKH